MSLSTPVHETAAAAGDGTRRVVSIDPGSDARWDAFVDSAGGSVHQRAAWFEVVRHAHGYRPVALACEDTAGQLTGVLPMVEKRGLLGGQRLASLPHTPCAGPLALDDRSLTALLQAAVEEARARGAWLQVKSAHDGLDGSVPGLVRTPWEATFVLDLPEVGEPLRFGDARNHGRLRWSVNKSRRCGVQVRPAEDEQDLRAWYRLYLDTMRWHVVPPRPFAFFRSIWQRLGAGDHVELLLAEQRDGRQARLLAGSLFLLSGDTVTYAFNGRRRDALHLRPNDALHWYAIEQACRRGVRHYDFGEVEAGNEGLADFKTKWGATGRQLYRYHYPASHEPEQGLLRAGSPTRRLADNAWRRLPLPVTAAVGGWVYGRL